VAEISAASSEQAAGVSQVGEAIGHIDQATQQNAALVEQMAAAAGSLKSQADELVQSVAVFKLNASDAPARAQRAPVAHRPVQFSAGKTLTHKASKPSAPPVAARKVALAAPKTQSKPAPAGGDDDWETF
jgi:hypothetical protein